MERAPTGELRLATLAAHTLSFRSDLTWSFAHLNSKDEIQIYGYLERAPQPMKSILYPKERSSPHIELDRPSARSLSDVEAT